MAEPPSSRTRPGGAVLVVVFLAAGVLGLCAWLGKVNGDISVGIWAALGLIGIFTAMALVGFLLRLGAAVTERLRQAPRSPAELAHARAVRQGVVASRQMRVDAVMDRSLDRAANLGSLLRRIVWPPDERVVYDNPTDQFFGDFRNFGFLNNLARLILLVFIPLVLVVWLTAADGPLGHEECQTLPTTDSNTGTTTTYQSCLNVGPFG